MHTHTGTSRILFVCMCVKQSLENGSCVYEVSRFLSKAPGEDAHQHPAKNPFHPQSVHEDIMVAQYQKDGQVGPPPGAWASQVVEPCIRVLGRSFFSRQNCRRSGVRSLEPRALIPGTAWRTIAASESEVQPEESQSHRCRAARGIQGRGLWLCRLSQHPRAKYP